MTNHNPASGALLDAAQAHALALAMYNAVNAQQQGAVVRQASTTMACAAMLSLGVAETAEGQSQPPVADSAATPPAPVAAALASAAKTVPPPPILPILPIDPVDLRGRAYQSAAFSTAIAIQDAADYLRTMATLASTATGVATAQFLANPGGAEAYNATMMATQQLMAAAVANFEAIGASAENLLKNFPPG